MRRRRKTGRHFGGKVFVVAIAIATAAAAAAPEWTIAGRGWQRRGERMI